MVRIGDGTVSVLFSGDLGRPHDPVMLESARPPQSDYVVVESTYGDRRHEAATAEKRLANIVTKTAGERLSRDGRTHASVSTMSLWDRAFGTYRAAPHAGHEAMTLGLSQFPDCYPGIRIGPKMALPTCVASPIVKSIPARGGD